MDERTDFMDEQQDKLKTRIVSIDALRGFDMFWIVGGAGIFTGLHKIFDNSVTDFICGQLHHVDWEGFHFEDLIFPLFLFIVGAVFPFALTKRIEQGQNKLRITGHIIRRGLTLILIGMILNGLLNFDFENMRWAGVLQRIGACYLIGALIVVYTNNWRWQASIAAAILLLYWAAAALIPVPGYGAGVITPEGCLSYYIDRLLLPGGHADAEGLLSTLPAVATVLIGVLAGHYLRSDKPGTKKAIGLAGAGVVCLIVGYLWGMVFPIIKVIWTSSFVMVAAGWSLLLLAVFYLVIDVLKFRKWAFFFIVIGMNAITIYVLNWVMDFGGIAGYFVSGLADWAGPGGELVTAIGFIAIEWLLLLMLYRKKIFFKV
jgi:predicted acyltransferase